MAASVFTRVAIYPILPEQTLVEWQLHPEFDRPSPYNFAIQFSRSGNPESDDWTTIAEVINDSFEVLDLTDNIRRHWSTSTRWYYRLRLSIPNGEPDEYYLSQPEPAWGTLGRRDILLLRELYRGECLRFRKGAGSSGLLFRRKHWGIRSSTRDPDTGEIIDSQSIEDYGTGFIGGYWKPFVYWMGLQAGLTEQVNQTGSGTMNNRVEVGRALAWPMPMSKDLWYNCHSGKLYEIIGTTVRARIRHLPAIYSVTMAELPSTDIAYQLPWLTDNAPVSDYSDQETMHWVISDTTHWFVNHWS